MREIDQNYSLKGECFLWSSDCFREKKRENLMWMCERAHVTSYWRVHHLEGELLTLHFITFCVWKDLEPSFIFEQLSQGKCEVACQAATISYHHPFWSGYLVQGVQNSLWKQNYFCWLFGCSSTVWGVQLSKASKKTQKIKMSAFTLSNSWYIPLHCISVSFLMKQ